MTASPTAAAPLPPPKYANSPVSTHVCTGNRCKEDVVDAVHIVGDGETFYMLTEADRKALKQETDKVDQVMKDYGGIVGGAKNAPACGVPAGKSTRDKCSCMGCQQWRWAKQAMDAGLLAVRNLIDDEAVKKLLMSDEDIQGQISELKKQRADYETLWPVTSDIGANGNVGKLQRKVTEQIDAEIKGLTARLATISRDSDSSASAAKPDADRASKTKTASATGSRSSRTVYGVVEIIVLGRTEKRYYIPARYKERIQQYESVTSTVLRTPGDLKTMADKLIDDIRKQVKEDRSKALGNLSVKLKTWKVPEDCAMNALHKEVHWTTKGGDTAPYAANAEAHMLRFAASASASVSGFDPHKGEVAVGIAGSASFALGEGKVELKQYFPNKGGYDCTFPYRNADGKTAYLRFGAFRLTGGVELSCFVGATVSGSAGAAAKWKATPAGGTAMLATPSVASKPGAAVQVKGNAFAGAQAGGALTGKVEWLSPDDQHKVQTGYKGERQPDAGANWNQLLEVKAEGNVAFGIGGEFDFEIKLNVNKLEFHAKAQLVFGPGAAGGFGTTVDLEQVANLVAVVYKAGHAADYHMLLAVQKDAFEYFYKSTYRALSSPGATLQKVMEQGSNVVAEWWKMRSSRMQEASSLSKYINGFKGRPVTFQAGNRLVPLYEAPPELLGTILYSLSESFVGTVQTDNERAIVKVLGDATVTWRRFIKVLERVSKDASPVAAYEGMRRINSFLTGKRQNEFNEYVDKLAQLPPVESPGAPQLAYLRPWSPIGPNEYGDGKIIMAARPVWGMDPYTGRALKDSDYA